MLEHKMTKILSKEKREFTFVGATLNQTINYQILILSFLWCWRTDPLCEGWKHFAYLRCMGPLERAFSFDECDTSFQVVIEGWRGIIYGVA